jgi:hypothetical protein
LLINRLFFNYYLSEKEKLMAEQATGPALRCPSCGNMVKLPAVECPQCQYNFRTGQRPAPPTDAGLEPASRRPYLIGGGVLALIIIVALFIFLGGEEPPVPESPPAAGGGSIVQPLPNTDQNSLLNPAQHINRANQVAGQVDANVERTDQLYEELEEEAKGGN